MVSRGRRDQATGQYTFGARRYNPTDAAWLTPDRYLTGPSGADLSIGIDPLTRNRYTYVNGDPINYWDPTGHGLCFFGVGIDCDDGESEACVWGFGLGCDEEDDGWLADVGDTGRVLSEIFILYPLTLAMEDLVTKVDEQLNVSIGGCLFYCWGMGIRHGEFYTYDGVSVGADLSLTIGFSDPEPACEVVGSSFELGYGYYLEVAESDVPGEVVDWGRTEGGLAFGFGSTLFHKKRVHAAGC